ncbi:MAG: flagellar biosynthetic protein FliR [Verrucomicrobia bacterium]|nr:flagellar biosynthetic protein FliR [Verrucomicrobiota bacterium]
MDLLAQVDTSDYVSYVLSFPGIDPLSVLSLFLLALMRIAPVVGIAPFLGSKLPTPVKMGLAISFSAILLPQLLHLSKMPPATYDMNFLLLSIKEVFIGMVLAIFITMPFYIAQASGTLIDFLRGSSALQVPDPFMQAQTSPIGILYNYILIVIFYQVGGPFLFLDGVLRSYAIVPADGWISPLFFSAQQPVWAATIKLLTQFTALSIQLAAPSIVAILMAEMFLGIANRLAPQVQIAFLGMSLKSLVGIALLWAAWFFILQQLGKQSLTWVQELNRLLFSIPIT